MSVRRANLADADGIWPLAREFATSFVPERTAFDRTLAALLERDDTLLLAATSGRSVVGYLLASAHLTFLANGAVVWVEEVMVDAAERRNGVGRRLMDAAESWASEIGAAYISLASRRAAAVYEALGYEDSATNFRKSLG